MFTTTLLGLLLTIASSSALELGNFRTRAHDVAGSVKVLSDRLLQIDNFVYDGTGPAAYLWIDSLPNPSNPTGKIIYDVGGSCGQDPLGAYATETLLVELPEGSRLQDYPGGSISVWCEAFSANFGEVLIPETITETIPATDPCDLQCDMDTTACIPSAEPMPFSLGEFTTRMHDVAGTVTILSDRVIEITNFVYDGLGPAAFFWIDSEPNPSNPTGKIAYDVGGSCGTEALAAYSNERVLVELPSSVRNYLGGSLSVWCERFSANFGEVLIPNELPADLPGGPALECAMETTSDPSATAEPMPFSLGEFTTRMHDVAGTVTILSDRVIEITNFFYDGLGPAAFFWIDSEPNPSNPTGKIAYDVGGSCGTEALAAYSNERVLVELPSSVRNYLGGSLSVWCERFSANFGEVLIPNELPADFPEGPALECAMDTTSTPSATEEPTPFSLGEFTTRMHDVAGTVTILSDRVIEITNFVYDGLGPAAFFWIDSEPNPSNPTGKIAYDVGGSCGTEALAAYSNERVLVELPSSVRNYLGGSLSVWCERFSANFGEVLIPNELPAYFPEGPALECAMEEETSPSQLAETPENFNCEQLHESLQVRWAVEGDTLAVELVAQDMLDYAAFGVSGSTERTLMVGGDPVVVDMVNGPRARDFRLTDQSRCSGGEGVCHDEASTSISQVSGDQEGPLTVIRYKKSISASDVPFSVAPGDSTFIVWAMGPMSSEGLPLFHTIFPRGENISLEFGRTVANNCEPLITEEDAMETDPVDLGPFERPVLQGETEIVAHIGPSGGDRGYAGITGRSPWGIAWYLNGLLIPELVLRRGTTYTFRVNGGDNPDSNAEYHPFYLTTNPNGGYATLSPEERAMETVFAGIRITEGSEGTAVTAFESTAEAPICSYRQLADSKLDGTYQEYFDSLDTSCKDDAELMSQAAVFEFTPNENTPDMIYYHCVTHPDLGWEVLILDAEEELVEPVVVDDSETSSAARSLSFAAVAMAMVGFVGFSMG